MVKESSVGQIVGSVYVCMYGDYGYGKQYLHLMQPSGRRRYRDGVYILYVVV